MLKQRSGSKTAKSLKQRSGSVLMAGMKLSKSGTLTNFRLWPEGEMYKLLIGMKRGGTKGPVRAGWSRQSNASWQWFEANALK